MRSLIAIGSLLMLMANQPKAKQHVLYLLFPTDGSKYTTQELVSYDRRTKERRYKPETVYHFPCKSVIGDFRFITIDQTNSRYVTDTFIKKVNVRDCRWVKAYAGSSLNQYRQNSEFSRIYVVEEELVNGKHKVLEVKPEIGEYN